MLETGVLVSKWQEPFYWHLPEHRSAVYLPDSSLLWDMFWTYRENVMGFAHSHPGSGIPAPSMTDLTTFSAIEAGLGRRLLWWITSEDTMIELQWQGPNPYDYRVEVVTNTEFARTWLQQLRANSYGPQEVQR
jgi:proteasome lid subunit RPN8/RPN11